MTPAESDQGRSGWVRELRRHHEGILLARDRAVAVRFIIEGGSGRLVMPVEGWMLDHQDAVLFLPEERDDALQVMVELEPGAAGEAQDRWGAYHGLCKLRDWARGRVVGLRREADVCDDRDFDAANPLRGVEPRLVKFLNARRDALAHACKHLAGVGVADACAVGVDPYGMDIRARFGIVRAEFPAASCGPAGCIECPEEAARVIAALVGVASEGGGIA